jgi:hypothetical protein
LQLLLRNAVSQTPAHLEAEGRKQEILKTVLEAPKPSETTADQMAPTAAPPNEAAHTEAMAVDADLPP